MIFRVCLSRGRSLPGEEVFNWSKGHVLSGLARVGRRHLSSEIAGMQRAKFEEG